MDWFWRVPLTDFANLSRMMAVPQNKNGNKYICLHTSIELFNLFHSFTTTIIILWYHISIRSHPPHIPIHFFILTKLTLVHFHFYEMNVDQYSCQCHPIGYLGTTYFYIYPFGRSYLSFLERRVVWQSLNSPVAR